MTEREPFNHSEINSRGYYVWSDERLVERFKDLEETQKLAHHAERRLAINHEMTCIAFELVSREIEIQKREYEIVQLETQFALAPVEPERVKNEQKPEDPSL